jgi:uncharacterized protein YraI
MMTEIAGHKMSISDLMTVAPISVHAGPAMGDGVVGVLPKGRRMPVVNKKKIRMGKYRREQVGG